MGKTDRNVPVQDKDTVMMIGVDIDGQVKEGYDVLHNTTLQKEPIAKIRGFEKFSSIQAQVVIAGDAKQTCVTQCTPSGY